MRFRPNLDAGIPTDLGSIPGLGQLWAETHGDARICVAVLDGPVDRSHPSLAAANLTQPEGQASGHTGFGAATRHGTHIASIIFGQHDQPVKGIAPGCRGMAIPIFGDAEDGSIAPCSQIELARAILQAIQEGAQIINISGGVYSPSGAADPILAEAVQKCAENNILIVAAAGNEGCECLHVPGALPSVLVVGAMNAQNWPLEFSNWGDKYRLQGILAPGENIPGAAPGGGIAVQSGTSFAAPVVSGTAALLASLQFKRGQKPDLRAVRAAILESAYRCNPQSVTDCRPFLIGSLNISGAQAIIQQGYRGFTASQFEIIPQGPISASASVQPRSTTSAESR